MGRCLLSFYSPTEHTFDWVGLLFLSPTSSFPWTVIGTLKFCYIPQLPLSFTVLFSVLIVFLGATCPSLCELNRHFSCHKRIRIVSVRSPIFSTLYCLPEVVG